MIQPKAGIMDIAPYRQGKSKSGYSGPILKLSSNESSLGPSPKALEAYRKAADTIHRYPDGSATELREAIGAAEGLNPAQLLCGAGSDELINLLIHAYAGPGDEVLTGKHAFLMYGIYCKAHGAALVEAQEKNLTIDVDALLACVTPRTKIVFIANPNNPTGTYVPAPELNRLRQALPKHVLLVIDNAYLEYVSAEDYTDGNALVDADVNTVTLRTFSKLHALSALRLGFAYAPASVIDVLNRVRSPFNVNTPAQMAGIAAITDTAHIAKAMSLNNTWRPWLAEKISELGLTVHKSHGNFLLVAFALDGEYTAANVNARLMQQGVIVREVTEYKLPHCLRVTVGMEEENEAFISALRESLGQ